MPTDTTDSLTHTRNFAGKEEHSHQHLYAFPRRRPDPIPTESRIQLISDSGLRELLPEFCFATDGNLLMTAIFSADGKYINQGTEAIPKTTVLDPFLPNPQYSAAILHLTPLWKALEEKYHSDSLTESETVQYETLKKILHCPLTGKFLDSGDNTKKPIFFNNSSYSFYGITQYFKENNRKDPAELFLFYLRSLPPETAEKLKDRYRSTPDTEKLNFLRSRFNQLPKPIRQELNVAATHCPQLFSSIIDPILNINIYPIGEQQKGFCEFPRADENMPQAIAIILQEHDIMAFDQFQKCLENGCWPEHMQKIVIPICYLDWVYRYRDQETGEYTVSECIRTRLEEYAAYYQTQPLGNPFRDLYDQLNIPVLAQRYVMQ